MQEYETQVYGDTRLRWVYDELHCTEGSYAYETEAETRAAEDWERERLADGRLVALGCIVEERVECACPDCDGWHERQERFTGNGKDYFDGPSSLWGIVIEPDAEKLREFAVHQGWIKADATAA